LAAPDKQPEGMPAGLIAYKRTPLFDETTLPDALRKSHSTKAGVWGALHVLEGELLFRRLAPLSEHRLEAGGPPWIIHPQELHEVSPIGSVRFYVEFYKKPE